MFILLIPWLLVCLIIGFIGINRRIGFFGAFILSIILSPLIGLIITLVSKNKKDIKREKEILKAQKKQAMSMKAIAEQSKQKSVSEELKELSQLKRDGEITDEEFNKLKSQLIN